MNVNNSNSEFQNFSECDLTKHWSYSNYNRNLMMANIIKDLADKRRYNLPNMILEIGAGDSPLEYMSVANFNTYCTEWIKIDGDAKRYKDDASIKLFDIESKDFYNFIQTLRCKPNVVVMSEVIEHMSSKESAKKVIENLYHVMEEESYLLLTTPTPPLDGIYEERVWPDDHEFEFTYDEIYDILNIYFKIEKKIGWSLEEREYNDLLKNDEFIGKTYLNLKGLMPEGYIRSLISLLAYPEMNRQVLLVCRKRRVIL
jgi:hypothetical protein